MTVCHMLQLMHDGVPSEPLAGRANGSNCRRASASIKNPYDESSLCSHLERHSGDERRVPARPLKVSDLALRHGETGNRAIHRPKSHLHLTICTLLAFFDDPPGFFIVVVRGRGWPLFEPACSPSLEEEKDQRKGHIPYCSDSINPVADCWGTLNKLREDGVLGRPTTLESTTATATSASTIEASASTVVASTSTVKPCPTTTAIRLTASRATEASPETTGVAFVSTARTTPAASSSALASFIIRCGDCSCDGESAQNQVLREGRSSIEAEMDVE
ncbi:hypothetical protein EDB80DRAFT_686662 [Ilyonectria destructans]|nr:hypothetical protein EDB80DRAFT_686662 [Ilyonectria destructans]